MGSPVGNMKGVRTLWKQASDAIEFGLHARAVDFQFVERQCQEGCNARAQYPISSHVGRIDFYFRPCRVGGIVDTPVGAHRFTRRRKIAKRDSWASAASAVSADLVSMLCIPFISIILHLWKYEGAVTF